MEKLKKIFLAFLLLLPIFSLILYTIKDIKGERGQSKINIDKIKIVSPVQNINRLVNLINEEKYEELISIINSEKIDLNIPSENGETLLVLATEKNLFEIVSLLLEKGADVNLPERRTSETALIKAVRNKDDDMVSLLVNMGADVNASNLQGTTPLGVAILTNNYTMAEYLLSHGARSGVNETNFWDYIYANNTTGILVMLHAGIKAQLVDDKQNTPLIIASANKNFEAVKELLNYDAEINAQNNFGMTAVLYAVKNQDDEILMYLIDHGADINLVNKAGQNVLFWAAYYGNEKLVKDLLLLGANYNQKTRRNQTALQIAKAYKHESTAKTIKTFIDYKNLPRDKKGNIILPKSNTQAQEQAPNNDLSSALPMSIEIPNIPQQNAKNSIPNQNNQKDTNANVLQTQENIPTQVNNTQTSSSINKMGSTSTTNQVNMPKGQNITKRNMLPSSRANNQNVSNTNGKQMISQEQIKQLKEAGISDEQIKNMQENPMAAMQILQSQQAKIMQNQPTDVPTNSDGTPQQMTEEHKQQMRQAGLSDADIELIEKDPEKAKQKFTQMQMGSMNFGNLGNLGNLGK